MKTEQCPICYSSLELVECTPCHDCGHFEEDIQKFKENGGNFNVYDLYNGLTLQLCDFCKIDFGSYKTDFLGFNDGTTIGFENMNFVKSVDNPKMGKDKFCPECSMRMKFLTFIHELREKIKELKNH
ncbi:hypothetical protein [Psychroserpens sp. SPM9]|uniref:hypothetical protein n=1 Tax=Psychroserpens sp. SPM9 TaxID=2975598 RepID=UPI0021A34180|nr:hypothetical protein [Psychroserpens sp. SPM9]MDG5493229.1 hypothetical protein [Psychroserpens sp. SPM9]